MEPLFRGTPWPNMPFEIATSIDIDASPARVWEVLTDFDRYPGWNPTIRQLDVRADGSRAGGEVGAKAGSKVFVRLNLGFPVAVMARIDRFEPERMLSWAGGVSPVFTAHHWFELEPLGEGTRLHHHERFGGVGASVIRWTLQERIERAYQRLNVALRARATAP